MAGLMIRCISGSGKYTWKTERLFVMWMVNLMGTRRMELWQHMFHAGVKRCVRNNVHSLCLETFTYEMKCKSVAVNMLRLQIWTQMKKCKRKFCIATLISHELIITIKYDIVMVRMWGTAQWWRLVPHFTFYDCHMQVFCISYVYVMIWSFILTRTIIFLILAMYRHYFCFLP